MNKNSKIIAEVFFSLAVEGPFDYLIPDVLQDHIQTGMRVSVLFNRKVRMGFVCGFKEKSDFEKLNVIIKVLDDTPIISEELQRLALKMSQYYGCTFGEAIEACLPKALRKSKSSQLKRITKKLAVGSSDVVNSLVYSFGKAEQWAIVLQKVEEVFQKNKSIVILVPEVKQLSGVLKCIPTHLQSFVISTDKKATAKKEFELFLSIREDSKRIIVGTRSAVFAPLNNLGLIVVFNEENKFYKQEQTPHYHAREVALMRGVIEQCHVCLVSSAPSTATWQMAKTNNWQIHNVITQLPNEVKVVDMTNYNPRKSSLISVPLEKQMQEVLMAGGRVALYLNLRRGKTANSDGSEFDEIRQKIIDRISRDVSWKFPTRKWVRYDADSKRIPKDVSIIVATQAILNLKEMLSVDLVGVINFDVELTHFDYCAAEKALSLLIQLRQLANKTLVIQTKMPDNDCVVTVKDLNFNRFYENELKLREDLELPPIKHLISLYLRGSDENKVSRYATDVFELFDKTMAQTMQCFEPQQEYGPKLRKFFKYTIMLKGDVVPEMIKYIKDSLKKIKRKSKVTITMEVD